MTYQIDNNIKMLHFDLNMTEACNMACDYCFEPKKNPKRLINVDSFIIKMREVIFSDYFQKNYELLNINFWGGEPTLEHDNMIYIIESLAEFNQIRFFIFSNGYDIEPIHSILEKYKNVTVKGNHPKVCIQISYDGHPLHNLHRLDKHKNLTGSKVVNSIKYLNQNGIPYVVKPVIKPSDFKYLPLVYGNIKKLTYEDNPLFFKSQNYNPTIEYYNSESATEEEVESNLRYLRKSMIQIAAEEYVAVKEQGHKPFFSWLFPSKAICGAGAGYFAIDTDGDIYPCHGVFYLDNKENLKITNLNNHDWLYKLQKSTKHLSGILQKLPDECKSCETNFCMKCNVVKFKNSQKTKYIERWTDYTNQPILCKYYKEIGKIAKIFNKKMRKG